MREFRCKERAVFSPVSPVRFCSLPTLPYPTATTTLLSTAAVQTLGQQQQQQLTVRQLNEFSYRFSLSLSFSFLLFFFRPCFAGLSLHVYSLVRRGIGRQKRQTNVCAPAPTAHTHTLLTHWERDCSLSAGEYSFSLFFSFSGASFSLSSSSSSSSWSSWSFHSCCRLCFSLRHFRTTQSVGLTACACLLDCHSFAIGLLSQRTTTALRP